MSRFSPLIFATILFGTTAGVAQAWGPPNAVNPMATVDPSWARTPVLTSSEQVFGFIAETLHLGSANDGDLIQRLEASSSVDHLHDYRGEDIFAVKPELYGSDGVSRVRAPDGNYPFFVFRQSARGWLMLGQMYGTGYEWSTQSRHLVFNMSVLNAPGARTPVRYEVNQDYLVNITELVRTERQNEKIVADWHTAF